MTSPPSPAAAIHMPWCQTCSRFLNPNTLGTDGSCPTCGRAVAEPTTTTVDGEHEKAPWHFKLLVLVTVIYLAWRAVQMVGWVAG